MNQFDKLFREIYSAFEDTDTAVEYSQRHNISSQAVLTVTNDETAGSITDYLSERIEGKTVVEIGGGIGLLGCHMAAIARQVFCIEANPMWSCVFASMLYAKKPKNLSYLFGSADEFIGIIKADVVVFCTHSGVESMRLVGRQFAPVVIDVYGEIIGANPEAFDPMARELRKIV
jgi:hypothetical protein